MKKIQILGTGCSKCNALVENTESALRLAGLDIPIEKVTDLQEILAAGIMMMPALVIDGEIKAVGKVLSPAEILEMLQVAGVQKDSPDATEPPAGAGTQAATKIGQEPATMPAKSGGKGTRIAIVVGLLLALGITLWAKNRGTAPAAPAETRSTAPASTAETRSTAPIDPSQPIVEDGTEASGAAGSKEASGPSASPVRSPVASATTSKPLPRMLDLGRGTCIPCKMMMPVLEELKTSLAGKLDVHYIDISKNPEAAQRWEIRMIPTQILIDEEGNELTRHTGFFPRVDIIAEWKRIGYDFEAKTPDTKTPNTKKQQD